MPSSAALNRAVADGVNVDDESRLIGGDAKLGKLLGIEKQVAIVSRVLVGLGEMRGLRGEFGDAIGEDFDSGDVQMRDGLVGILRLAHKGQFGGRILGENSGKRHDLRIQLAVIGEHLVGPQ
jgi:hypothetical protein